MKPSGTHTDHRVLVETARGEVERRLNASVVKGVAQVRRRSIVAGFELAPRGNKTDLIRVAVKSPRPDPQIPEFDLPAELPEHAVTREFAALAAVSRLHADHAGALTAVGVPKPEFILDRPLGLLMSFVTGHALRDVLTGGYLLGIALLADRTAEKAAGLATLMAGFGEAAVGAARSGGGNGGG